MNKTGESVVTACMVLTMLLVVMVSVAPRLGWQVYTPLSTSMHPTIKTGDLVVAHPIAPHDIQIGDIIAYGSPLDGRVTIHRVVEIKTYSQPMFRTQGDANEDRDPYLVPHQNVVGKVCVTLPLLGYVTRFVKTPLGVILTLVIPGLTVIGMEADTIRSELRARRTSAKKSRKTVKLKLGSLVLVSLFACSLTTAGHLASVTDQETSSNNRLEAGTWAPWLSGWDNRVKITIDHTDVDAVLSDFPVMISLSPSSGRTSRDVSFVFQELQSDANRRKIAVTTSNGVTQCYVEIETWDNSSEQAWLWVRVPSISNTSDTDLYLYYDVDQADNAEYVGDVGSTPAELVWDGKFVAVWHLSELTGGAGAIKDSTSNDNDGTDSGGPALDVTGRIGNAISFDGLNDAITVPDDGSLHLGGGLTIEAWINIDVWGDWQDIVFKGGGAASNSDYQFALVHNGLAWDGTYAGSWRTKYFPTPQDTGTWIYTVITHDTAIVTCYRDAVEVSAQSDAGAIYESTYQLGISREGAATRGYLEGTLDEIRISNTARSPAWIKAASESGSDDFLAFGDKEATTGWGSYSSELLGNGGAETGTTTGWTAIGPNAGNFAVGDDCPSGTTGPHTGAYTFFWNNPTSPDDWAYQEVDLTPWLSEIQAGDAQIQVKGWLVCSEYHVPPWDIVRMRVVFYDGVNQEISTATYDTGERGDLQEWTAFGVDDHDIPTNAVKVRVWFQTYESDWDAGNADDFTVKVRVRE